MLKIALGLLLGFGIGAMTRWFDIPVPAPPKIPGALLVVAMTLGYVATDRWLGREPAQSAEACGGPTGEVPHEETSPTDGSPA